MKFILNIFISVIISQTFLFAEDYVIIVNNNTPTPTEKLSSSDISSIYSLNKTYWIDGNDIIIFDYREDSKIKSTFYEYISKSEAALKKSWLRKKLIEGMDIPLLADSPEQMLKEIAETPGAIGYIPKEKLDSSVKVIAEFSD